MSLDAKKVRAFLKGGMNYRGSDERCKSYLFTAIDRIEELEAEAIERAQAMVPRPVGSVKRDGAPKSLGWCSESKTWTTVWWDDGWRDDYGLRYPTHLLPCPPAPSILETK